MVWRRLTFEAFSTWHVVNFSDLIGVVAEL
jgi:hypothetical protein